MKAGLCPQGRKHEQKEIMMPNWTSNRIYAEGSPEQISEFLDKIKGDNGVLDFNRIIPMPELLKNTGSGSSTIHGKRVSEWYVVNHGNHELNIPESIRVFTPEEEAELQEIGHRSWYDWSNANWGTKWNACDPEIEDEGSAKCGYIRILFMTAWSAPEPILYKLAGMFPSLSITCEWRHEDESEYPHSLEFSAKGPAGAA
jgi:hypothetical protein